MKKIMLILFLCGATGAVFAQEVSELYKEFLRRQSVVFTKNEMKAFTFMTRLGVDPKSVEKIEFLDVNSPSEFLIKVKNGDICLGDLDQELLRCKNEMGFSTVEYNGDAD